MRRRTTALVVVLAGVAAAWPLQVTGYNQNAHYALVKALARGVPYVDRTLGETGDLQSRDVARHDGHLYAVKAPGLAFAATPAYAAVEAAGARTTGDPTRVLWVLTLSTSVAATLGLVLLVRAAANRIEPGTGLATAAAVGLGALVLPFATLFFSHALSTALVFAGFALLVRRARTTGRLAGAGLATGAALVVEHSVWPAALVVAGYAVLTTRPLRQAALYVAGAAVGVLPLFAFNLWAFGDPLHTPYIDYWRTHPDFDTTPVPELDGLTKQLFSSLGLLPAAPVLALGLAGAAALYRRGVRAEALVCVAVPAVTIVYFAGNDAFGGLGPPRYLAPIMPFALLPLAVAFRRWPFATLAAAAVTVFQAALKTATGPLAAYDGEWLGRAGEQRFVATVASFAGVTGWYAILPFFLAVGLAALLAASSLRPLLRRATDAAAVALVLGGWALVSLASTNDAGREPDLAYVLVVVAVLSLATALAFALPPRGAQRARSQATEP